MSTHPLVTLHADIDDRVGQIRGTHPDWRCAKGCDHCCRRLAEIPQLTPAEWSLLKAGLLALPPEDLARIRQRVSALADNPTRPIVCPLLDDTHGACPVYAQRPIACRTYGFYVQRDLGLYCSDIESQVAEGVLAEVVWGNHEAVDQALAALGPPTPLTDWFGELAEAPIPSKFAPG